MTVKTWMQNLFAAWNSRKSSPTASTAPGNPPNTPQPPPLLENLQCCHFWLKQTSNPHQPLPSISDGGYINFLSQEAKITYYFAQNSSLLEPTSPQPTYSEVCIMILGDDLYYQRDGIWQQKSGGIAYFEKVCREIWKIASMIPSPEGLRNHGPGFFDERIVTLPEEGGKEAYSYSYHPQFGDSYSWTVGVEDQILRRLSYSQYLGVCNGKQISFQITQINQAIALHPPIVDSPTDSGNSSKSN